MKKRQLIWTILSIFFVSLVVGFAPAQPVQAQDEPIIITVAGNGIPGYTGNGGQAASAQLNYPSAIVFDNQGNMYIADSDNHCVRKVDINGIITTYAGCGIKGSSGDGGPAVLAQLHTPEALALDRDGNLYIADLNGFCVRKVDTQGNISTVAGCGTLGTAGDGGAATSAKLFGTFGLIVDDKNNLYISDFDRIRKVDSAGIISTFAGTGHFDYTGDGGPANMADIGPAFALAFDDKHNLYFVDSGNNCIRKIDNAGMISTVAGIGIPNEGGYSGDGGPATMAKFYYPQGISFDKAGNMFIADTRNNCIRKVDTAGIISTIAGNGTIGYSGDGRPAKLALLSGPRAVTFDTGGNMYIADSANHCIRKVIFSESGSENVINTSEVVLKIGSPKMFVGDIEKDIDPGYATVPEVVNDRTFVPIRAIVENLGGSVDWNEDEQKVIIKANNVQVVVQIGNTYATVNGSYKVLDDKPYISTTGRSMLPLRFISESLGYEVIWDDVNSSITIR